MMTSVQKKLLLNLKKAIMYTTTDPNTYYYYIIQYTRRSSIQKLVNPQQELVNVMDNTKPLTES